MLRAKGITKTYRNGGKELCVLKDVHLVVAAHEVVAIVGPSGAGKSTLLHILGGLDDPTQGEVYLGDLCLNTLHDAAKAMVRNTRFGFVFQFYHLLQEFTALENVMMPALIRQGRGVITRDLKKKAGDLLAFLGLAERLTHRPSELSGGEQQRVAIARALMNDPEILFCDEPTGNLDYESGRQIQDFLMRLNREKRMTIVLVTHSRELAQGSHRVLNIFDGRIHDAATASVGGPA
jgi:lipoprotein-releasing system ATP-binding protein